MEILHTLDELSKIGKMTIARYLLLLKMSEYKLFTLCDEFEFQSPGYNSMRFAIDDFYAMKFTGRVPTPKGQPPLRKYYKVSPRITKALKKCNPGTKDVLVLLNAAGFTSLAHAKVFLLIAQGISDRRDLIHASETLTTGLKPALIYQIVSIVNGSANNYREIVWGRQYLRIVKGSKGQAIEINQKGKALYGRLLSAISVCQEPI